jgi:type IV secretion system protein VirB11
VEQLISEVSKTPMRELIGEAVDVVVFLQRIARFGPKVVEILEVKGVDEKGWYEYEFVFKTA